MAFHLSSGAGRSALLALACVLTSACGGGGDSAAGPATAAPASAAGTPITRVIVAGDSLADSGTFGFRATVQSAANPGTGYPVYPELVAISLGLTAPCNYFSSTDEGQSFTANAGCTNYAVAASAVANPVVRGGDDVPFSLEHQLETAVAANGGAWRPGDLVIVNAGGNDAAGLADAYLEAQGGGAEAAIYLALLGQQLDASTLAEAATRPDGDTYAAGLYMEALARTFWTAVKANTLDRGATRVAVLNVPDLTLTPRFRDITAGIASAQGPAEAAAFQSQLRQWIAGFNAELARLVAGDPRVALVRYAEDFTAQATTPATFGLTNVTTASCPPGDFPDCTDAALDAAPPAGLAPGWWRTWSFSDGFHPSPRAHELLAATVNRALVAAGWR